ncbi:MAG TPA: hypothetical protein VGM50_22060 [Gemmatimonadaceae bacterium]|jgi:hypothetical protein
MNSTIRRTGLVSAALALATVAACSNKAPSKADASLKADLAAVGGSGGDLQLAPNSAKSSVVVSEIEGGPKSAPIRAAQTRAPRPVQHEAPPQISKEPQVTAPAPAQVAAAEPAPAPAPQPEQPAMQAPRQTRAPAPQQDRRVYKTEAEVFRQMPWIRP